MAERIPEKDWKWFGNNGHLLVGHDCRFHLATQIGEWLVSTVGEWWDDGDAAYIERFGYKDIGCDRKYETMVFRAGEPCQCGCGIPDTLGSEEDFGAYNSAKDAIEGHMELCRKWAEPAPQSDALDDTLRQGREG